jgi:hypothetical protein
MAKNKRIETPEDTIATIADVEVMMIKTMIMPNQTYEVGKRYVLEPNVYDLFVKLNAIRK